MYVKLISSWFSSSAYNTIAMGKTKETKINMDGLWYTFTDELTPDEEEFFAMVERCDLTAVEQFLILNRIKNVNMKNYQGITPLHLAVQNDCEPLVDLFLRQKGVRIDDSVLFAITQDNVGLLGRLLDYKENSGGGGGITAADDDSDAFPEFMTPLMLAAQCGRYETIEFLLDRGHKLDRPHPPRCACGERCAAAAAAARDVVADGCERLNAYRAISNPTYVCCTAVVDPILVCFRLHDELLECGDVDQVYVSVYTAMAQQVRQLAMEMIVNCRTSDEVKTLLRNRDGCKFRGRFPYPRLITAMDHRQKEFVAHTNVQQVLETAWIGDWIEWKSYSPLRQWSYPAWRLAALPVTVALGVLAPDSSWNRGNRLPINRMYNGLVTYVAFLALLFVQSNSDKYQTGRGAPRTPACALVAVFVLGHAFEKVRLRTLQGPGRYFGNPWNVFDTVKLTLFAAAYACWLGAAAQLRWVDVDLDRKYWHWADPQLMAEGLFAVATVMAYLRLLFLCQLNYYVGPMQVSLGKALQRDFGKFVTFLVVIMAAFTSGLGTLYGYYAGMVRKDPETGQVTRQEYSFVTVGHTFKTLFWGIFCMTSLEAPNVVVGNGGDATLDVQQHHFTQLVGYGLFAAFEVLMVIVMLNMLIAAMSDTFQRVADNAEYEWLFGRTEVYVDYMLMDDLPPPFNLLPTARLFTGRLFAAGASRYGDLHDDDDDDDDDPAESRALTAELIRRYFTHQTQMDRS